MGYESLNLLRGYKTNKNDVVQEFYLPLNSLYCINELLDSSLPPH